MAKEWQNARMSAIAERIPVIDTDSHVSEPPDLWQKRLPKKWADVMPRIELDEQRGIEYWLVGDRRVSAAWSFSVAGYREFMPAHPLVQDDVDPAMYDPVARAKKLDEFGIAAQVLYPNILGFFIQSLLQVPDPKFHLACVQAYNDFLSEWSAAAPGRFIPVMALPFWDVDASVAEMHRCIELGHRGVLFANAPEKAGMPRMRDHHWDPIYSTAQDMGIAINFHVGFGVTPPPPGAPAWTSDAVSEIESERADRRADFVKSTTLGLMSNSNAIVDLCLSGLLERFPRLNFVSVESGFGYVPYLLETMDWQWLNTGAARSYPDRMMPSEYFRRQVYATFWFERDVIVQARRGIAGQRDVRERLSASHVPRSGTGVLYGQPQERDRVQPLEPARGRPAQAAVRQRGAGLRARGTQTGAGTIRSTSRGCWGSCGHS